VCEWLSEAVAHMPAAVSLLLLEVLFMQISGVSLTLTYPHSLCLPRVLLGVTANTNSFPLSKHTGSGDTEPAFSGQHDYLPFKWEVGLPPSTVEFSSHHCFYKVSCSWLLGRCHLSYLVQLACLFTVHVGSGSSPLSCGIFLPLPLLQLSRYWFLGMCCRSCLLRPACLFTVPWGISPPPCSAFRAPHPLCHLSFLLLLIIQFLFFLCVGVGLSRGLCWSVPGLSVGVPHAS
jgi:hypothetical protein